MQDIDAKFGKIWSALRKMNIHTPQEYARLLQKVFDKNIVKCEVLDVFVIPDYQAWLEPVIDPHLSRWTKEIYTQLQWKFTATEPNEYFPTGVKAMWVIPPSHDPDILMRFLFPLSSGTGLIATILLLRSKSRSRPTIHLVGSTLVSKPHKFIFVGFPWTIP